MQVLGYLHMHRPWCIFAFSDADRMIAFGDWDPDYRYRAHEVRHDRWTEARGWGEARGVAAAFWFSKMWLDRVRESTKVLLSCIGCHLVAATGKDACCVTATILI